jgi:hypothetical protein
LVLLIFGVVLSFVAIIAGVINAGWGIAIGFLAAVVDIVSIHYWWYCNTGLSSRGATVVGHTRLYYNQNWYFRWGYAWFRYWYCNG